MGDGLSTIGFLLCGLAALGHEAKALRSLDEVATTLRNSWQQEYLLRQCGAKAATAANLHASGRFLSHQRPQLRGLVDQIEGELGAVLWAGASSQINSGGICRQAGPWPLHSELHRQHHRGQSDTWPNWILHLKPTS